MAVGKEVKVKINSIKSTQKITSAMEMVAASKMKRAQERMTIGKPYAQNILRIVSHIAHANSEFKHTFMEKREAKQVGYIVVSTDRGLCGGLNVNLFKTLMNDIKSWQQKNIEVQFCALGNKAISFFNSYGGNLISAAKDLGDNPTLVDLLGSAQNLIHAYETGKIDRLYLVSNAFVNTMTQKPQIQQLLPLPKETLEYKTGRWDYIYEPDDAELLLSSLFKRYIESLILQAVVENKACEMAARMIAMKNATENAGNFIDELQLLYNKTRQAAITQELSEIVSGAAAI